MAPPSLFQAPFPKLIYCDELMSVSWVTVCITVSSSFNPPLCLDDILDYAKSKNYITIHNLYNAVQLYNYYVLT